MHSYAKYEKAYLHNSFVNGFHPGSRGGSGSIKIVTNFAYGLKCEW